MPRCWRRALDDAQVRRIEHAALPAAGRWARRSSWPTSSSSWAAGAAAGQGGRRAAAAPGREAGLARIVLRMLAEVGRSY